MEEAVEEVPREEGETIQLREQPPATLAERMGSRAPTAPVSLVAIAVALRMGTGHMNVQTWTMHGAREYLPAA